MNKKTLIIALVVVLLGIIGFVVYSNSKNVKSDAQKFSEEYNLNDESNPFVYKTSDEIINILENGTGIVYLGYPECPWCKEYVKMLVSVFKKTSVDTIYYFDIKEDRESNSENYKKIVSILSDNLEYDDEGNKRVYVPDITFVKKGKIIGHDNETSLIFEDIQPSEYWTSEKVSALEAKLEGLMLDVAGNICTSCK